MTDTKVIERPRKNATAADRLAALIVERDHLKSLLDGRDQFIVDQGLWRAFVDTRLFGADAARWYAANRLAALIAERDKLKEALEPFAKEAAKWAAIHGDEHRPVCDTGGSACDFCGKDPGYDRAEFTAGDLRRALRIQHPGITDETMQKVSDVMDNFPTSEEIASTRDQLKEAVEIIRMLIGKDGHWEAREAFDATAKGRTFLAKMESGR